MNINFIEENIKDLSLVKYINDYTPRGWEEFFQTQRPEIEKISEKLEREKNAKKAIIPPNYNIFRAFYETSLFDIKVVLIGQDPYPTREKAMGLSFSVYDGIPVPPSLKTIYKALEKDGFEVNNKSGNLKKWTNEGVFLINAALTLVERQSNSHSAYWKNFSEKCISYISAKTKNIVFILLGKFAQNFDTFIDDKKHKIIKAPHPSPLSPIHGKLIDMGIFKECNEYLRKNGKDEVDFNLK